MSFTEPAETVRRTLAIHFETNSTDVTARYLDDYYISLKEVGDGAASSAKAAEKILSNDVGERL